MRKLGQQCALNRLNLWELFSLAPIREAGRRVEGSFMEVMAGLVLAATAVGFVLGYGVREAISQHRRAEARRRRHI
jgi:hypothetical protein